MGKIKPRNPPKPPQQIVPFSSRSENESPIQAVDLSEPSSAGGPTVISSQAVEITSSVIVHIPPNAQSIVQETVLAIESRANLKVTSGEPNQSESDTVKVDLPTDPVPQIRVPMKETSGPLQTIDQTVNPNLVAESTHVTEPKAARSDSWADLVKGSSKQLKKKGQVFTLASGESCVKIPNAVIERNKRSWDCFILGQFYSDPTSQGTIHNIVNGIWSKQMRDVLVLKMEGNAFLFKIPNSFTRNRVLNQRLWKIEGQTMFVTKGTPS